MTSIGETALHWNHCSNTPALSSLSPVLATRTLRPAFCAPNRPSRGAFTPSGLARGHLRTPCLEIRARFRQKGAPIARNRAPALEKRAPSNQTPHSKSRSLRSEWSCTKLFDPLLRLGFVLPALHFGPHRASITSSPRAGCRAWSSTVSSWGSTLAIPKVDDFLELGIQAR
jgi:hypothetical protein